MKYCEKCGKELGPDGVCDCQKTPEETKEQVSAAVEVSEAAAVKEEKAAETTEPAAKEAAQEASETKDASKEKEPKKGNKTAIIVAAAVAAFLLVVVIAVAVSSANAYRAPINKLAKLINSKNTDVFAYQELMVSPMALNYNRSTYQILKKNPDIQEKFDDAKEELKDLYQDMEGLKITKVDFIKAEEMKRSEIREIQKKYDADKYKEKIEDLQDMDKGDYEDGADLLDISVADTKKFVKETINYYKALSKVNVTKGYKVTVRFYGKAGKDTDKTDKLEDIRVINMNGKWYIYDASSLIKGMEFKDDLSGISPSKIYNIVRQVNLSSQMLY